MKKLVAGLLVIMLVFTFTGCGAVDKVLEKFQTTLNQTLEKETTERRADLQRYEKRVLSKEEALKKILEQMHKLYPDATEKEILKEI